MRSSTGKHTQQLDGFQVVREGLIVEGCGVEDLSRLARLSCHRRRGLRLNSHRPPLNSQPPRRRGASSAG